MGKSRSKNEDQDQGQGQQPPAPRAVASSQDEILNSVIKRRIQQRKDEELMVAAYLSDPDNYEAVFG